MKRKHNTIVSVHVEPFRGGWRPIAKHNNGDLVPLAQDPMPESDARRSATTYALNVGLPAPWPGLVEPWGREQRQQKGTGKMRDDTNAPAEAAPQLETTDVKATAKKTTAPAPAKKAAAPTPAPRRSRKEAAENLKRAKAEIRSAKAGKKAAPKAAPKAIVEAIDKHQRKAGARADGLTPGTGAAILVDTLSRKNGATNAELCEAVGWAACLPAARKACERAGLRFEAVKEAGELTRYFARKK